MMFQMPILLQSLPQVILTCREMPLSEPIDHIRRDLVSVAIIITKEIVLRSRDVGEERDGEMGEDRHESIIFVHPWE